MLCCIALTTRCKPWRSLCVQFFAPPSTPFFWLALGFGLLALLTLAGWTTEFGAHRAAFTVHAPARHLVSDTLFCPTLRPGSTGRDGAEFQLGTLFSFFVLCSGVFLSLFWGFPAT